MTSLSSPRRRVVLHALLALILAWIAATSVYGARFWSQIPVLSAETFSLPQTIMVTDRDGRELVRFHGDRDVVEINKEDMPSALRDAFVAIEDKRFFERQCVDVRALSRAAVSTFVDEQRQGGSTITQQLVGLLLENRQERTIRRKVNEMLLACRMEWTMSKDEILTLYLNRVPFGGEVYGVEQASRTFFGVHARELTLAQSAILASLPQRPTTLSPYGSNRFSRISGTGEILIREGTITDPAALPGDEWQLGLLGRQIRTKQGMTFLLPGRANLVLAGMRENETISAVDLRDAEEDLRRMRFREQRPASPDAPYFVRQVKDLLPSLLASTPELRERQWSGLTVKTTLDRDLQRLAEGVIAKHADGFRKKFGVDNISLVAIDAKTGEIVAYVGNVKPAGTETVPGQGYDMASVPRQPGSSFKPFVYATAFEEGKLTPESLVLDGPLTLGAAHPQNYEGGYWGWIRVKAALAGSRNIPAIRTYLMAGGEEAVLDTAYRAGIRTPTQVLSDERDEQQNFTYGWPLAIGSAEIPLTEMVQGYATIANDGSMVPLTSVLSISQAKDEGQVLPLALAGKEEGMDPATARELKDILKNRSLRPSAGWKKMLDTGDIETAAKTGTSNQCRGIDVRTGLCTLRLPSDTWTMGFSPSLVVGVWAGNATFKALSPQADGLDVAAPIWREFMIAAHELRPEMQKAFTVPEKTPAKKLANR